MNRLVYFLPAATVIFCDQIAKKWAQESDLLLQPLVLAPVLRLVYAENTGAAFGLFADGGAVGRIILSLFAFAVAVALAVYLCRRPPLPEALACSSLLGGAAGNLIDRVKQGYVVDFIDAHWGEYHWPAFNVADMAVCFGAALLAWRLCFSAPAAP